MRAMTLPTRPDVQPLTTLFHDDRGQTAILVDKTEPIDFLEYLDFARPEAVRGGHFHAAYTEHFYVAEGQLAAELLDCTDGEPGILIEFSLEPGLLLRIPPGWAHRFTARAPTRALAFGFGKSPLVDRTNVPSESWPSTEAHK